METSRVDGVEAPQHFKTPRSHTCPAQALRERLELAEDPQGEASQLSIAGHLHGAQLVGAPELFQIRRSAVHFILYVFGGHYGLRGFHFVGPESPTDQIKAPAHLSRGYLVLYDQ